MRPVIVALVKAVVTLWLNHCGFHSHLYHIFHITLACSGCLQNIDLNIRLKSNAKLNEQQGPSKICTPVPTTTW